MNIGIYKIQNITDNKVYIGSSVDIKSRQYKHFWMLTLGSHYNSHLQSSYNKFGKDSFILTFITLLTQLMDIIKQRLMSLDEILLMQMSN